MQPEKKSLVPMVNFMNKIPGGIMLIPLLVGCTLNSFFPDFLQIGGATTGVLTSTNAFLGAFFVCVGANLSISGAGKALKVGAVVTLAKLVASIAVGLIASHIFNDNLLGLSAVAIISGMSNSNGGMFTVLTKMYGDDADQGAIAVVSLNDGPFFTMIALGSAGMADIPLMALVAALVPLVIGIILGNLDPKMKRLLNEAEPVIIVFLAVAVGCSMNFSQIISGGFGGIVLGLMTLIIGGIITVFFDRITGGTGIAGAAISTVAGNAVATPLAVAAADPSIYDAAVIATPQVAAAMIITAILCPFFTAFVNKHFRRKDPVPVGDVTPKLSEVEELANEEGAHEPVEK
jgi:2-keto-3-deoxygluconate permease